MIGVSDAKQRYDYVEDYLQPFRSINPDWSPNEHQLHQYFTLLAHDPDSVKSFVEGLLPRGNSDKKVASVDIYTALKAFRTNRQIVMPYDTPASDTLKYRIDVPNDVFEQLLDFRTELTAHVARFYLGGEQYPFEAGESSPLYNYGVMNADMISLESDRDNVTLLIKSQSGKACNLSPDSKGIVSKHCR
ncbi:MAG: hypothetical protein WDO15_06225 [Bacteroidota bacterium]